MFVVVVVKGTKREYFNGGGEGKGESLTGIVSSTTKQANNTVHRESPGSNVGVTRSLVQHVRRGNMFVGLLCLSG